MVDPRAFQNSRPPALSQGLKPSSLLGRFELKRQLGQGAQSTVWLAYDPRMEREVAIKVLRPTAGADELAVKQWLQEARSVGRVKHPSIVPVFEADIHEQYTYLVFEYVAGDTLAQLLARRGALPAREAAALMMDVLDAVAVAHTEGVVHRDIKPSNILVDSTGRARVMDFGIAARVRNMADSAAVAVGGTVGYMSPEALAGSQPAPSMDLFACGLVLAELLIGKPLIEESDSNRAMYRAAHEQLALPEGLGSDVDDGLRSLVNRALARDPQQRFGDARSFFNALNTWRQPPATGGEEQGGGNSGGTLEFLMRRMRHKSDFPALSASVVQIQAMASSDTESVSSVTNQILKDVALTNKLLRVVNSAHFARGGSISTVSRAVTLVGFNGIRNMALSLVLLEHMQDKGHAAQLKDEFVRSLLAATLGAELCTNAKDAEEAFIGSMFQNMGRLLVQFYFPEEASQVRSQMQSETPAISEAAASLRVLGLSYENLGIGIARAWGLPVNIQKCMKFPVGGPPASAPADSTERMRWVAVAANEMADVMLKYEPEEASGHLTRVARKYVHAVGSSDKLMQAAVDQAKNKLVEMATAMEIRVKPDSAAHKLLHVAVEAAAPVSGREGMATDSQINSLALHATQAVDAGTAPALEKSNQVAETLAAGIQDITNAMVEDFKLSDVLRMILETMFRAMHFDRIIFCMRDPKTESVTGRFGLGEGVEAFAKGFKVPLKAATPDLFGVVCIKGLDSMISDAHEARIQQRLPAWYLQSLNAPAFLLLPLQIKGAPFGLIYADKTRKGALELDEKELALLRTLRNQAVMAFKQSR
jgi:eukaryotic-like serine/threonine-protein kinase